MNLHIAQGENFLKNCLFDGLAHSYDVVQKKYTKPYPEVTGYLLTYFFENGAEEDSLIQAADYLVTMQNQDCGGWPSFYNTKILYVFDTSQILIGLCAAYEKTKRESYLNAALKGGAFLKGMQLENGAFLPIYDSEKNEFIIGNKTYSMWKGPFSGLMCKITEGYRALHRVTGEKAYLECIARTADFYSHAPYIPYTHPLGYWLEGLYEAGRLEQVEKVLTGKVIPRIEENGYIAYSDSLPYAYVSGTIQLGILLYKMGYVNHAKLIQSYGETVQGNHTSGGLFQYADSKGRLDTHVHKEINSWGTKYFCQLERLLDDDKNREGAE